VRKECDFGQFSHDGMLETRTRGIGFTTARIKLQQTLALSSCVRDTSLESEMIIFRLIVDRCHINTSVREQVTMGG
jgi:hypothetical protein